MLSHIDRSGIKADNTWGDLKSLGSDELRLRVEARYRELDGLDEGERMESLRAMALAEYDLDSEELRRFTRARLEAWLRMEQGAAERIASAYNSVMDAMPAGPAMRRVTLIQSLFPSFNPEEQDKLRSLIPQAIVGMAAPPVTGGARVPEPKRRWWAVWERRRSATDGAEGEEDERPRR
jgi:hypothetical protein